MSRRTALVFAMATLALLVAPIVLGQAGFDLLRPTIDGGGSTDMSGGDYHMGATVGQSDAGSLSAGVFDLRGGFWIPRAGTLATSALYLPCLNPSN